MNKKNWHSVVICFQISIFEPLETTSRERWDSGVMLWFAFKLVSLNHWKQLTNFVASNNKVVICFQISIFEPLETTKQKHYDTDNRLWFAFKLVSLNHWKQQEIGINSLRTVVICFQISIFEPLETTFFNPLYWTVRLWFAFKLVSLNHWKQQNICYKLITN